MQVLEKYFEFTVSRQMFVFIDSYIQVVILLKRLDLLGFTLNKKKKKNKNCYFRIV